MGDAAGELANRLHFSRLMQLFPCAVLFGDVLFTAIKWLISPLLLWTGVMVIFLIIKGAIFAPVDLIRPARPGPSGWCSKGP